ncbi:MAG: PIN domain-containing protein [Candidatus Lokiarchaeota archaeon]|nr:PIN domain-containing protein [Candidatus Lokiarchaeota archaeon]
MKLIVDANILFAALIKDGMTSKLLFSDKLHLLTPEYIFLEFRKYEKIIINKTKRTREDFRNFFGILKEKIQIIPEHIFRDYLQKAKEISPDPKDVIYIACALAKKANIWSYDRALRKNQTAIKIITTPELVKKIAK